MTSGSLIFLVKILGMAARETNMLAPENGWLEYDPFLFG